MCYDTEQRAHRIHQSNTQPPTLGCSLKIAKKKMANKRDCTPKIIFSLSPQLIMDCNEPGHRHPHKSQDKCFVEVSLAVSSFNF